MTEKKIRWKNLPVTPVEVEETAMESAQKYIDEHESESNVYELCSVCQESINPEQPHFCGEHHHHVDMEVMKKLLRYSFKDVFDFEENFRHLTRIEQAIIGSQENFDRLLSTLRDEDDYWVVNPDDKTFKPEGPMSFHSAKIHQQRLIDFDGGKFEIEKIEFVEDKDACPVCGECCCCNNCCSVV